MNRSLSFIVLALAAGCSKHGGPKTVIAVDHLLTPARIERGLAALGRDHDESAVREWQFGPEAELAPWSVNPNLELTERSKEGFHFDVGRPWPLLQLPLDLGPGDFNAVLIRMRSAGGPGHSGQVVWNWTTSQRGTKRFDLHGDEQFHDYLVVLGSHPRWRGAIVDFGINPLFVVTGAQRSDITIERIALLRLSPASLLRAEGYTASTPFWTIDDESRPVLAAALGHREILALTPTEGTRLVLEGMLPPVLAAEGAGVLFEAWAVAGGERHRLLSETLIRAPGGPTPHFERKMSLERWEGRPIEIELRLERPDRRGLAAEGGLWVEPRRVERAPIDEAPDRPRRIVLVTVDTLRADHLTAYGAEGIDTTFFDSLAERGARFDVCYSTANATNPSHASILTSLALQDHGVYDNETPLSSSVPTLASILRERGYRTAAIVSAPHLAARHSGLGTGFDIYSAPPPRRLYPQAAETTERALRLLERVQDEPLFLWVHYFDPHIPYRAPEPYASLYYEGDPRSDEHPGLGDLALEPGWEEHPYWDFLDGIRDVDWLAAQYRSEISYVDAELRRLWRGLQRLPGARNTFLAVTSDHGESLGEHGVFYEHFGLHDTITRVPLFLLGPGVPPATIVTSPVSTLDVLPTLLDLVPGARPPSSVRGRSLLGYPRSPDAEPRRPIYFEHTHQWQVGVRSDDYKLIVTLADGESHTAYRFEKGALELYDLQADPGETVNLAESAPALVGLGQHLIKEYHEARRTGLAAGGSERDPAMAAVLRQLGYTGGR